ncbi:MAG TPA: pyrroloquinoline quinone-dependent dehydrogenase [Gammaproteobacteria bacterium]|jgi:quinoprotein glucose dehydrogenase|nr:pyrroloquinoline quinone-dependent dehydrogenase [Gammaproteobacteria bacterium]HIL62894.1 pyrroloquinoline quinone-dependent dehydrogenase [Porticoccaceae bacterium]
MSTKNKNNGRTIARACQLMLFAVSLLYLPYLTAQYGTGSGDWPSYGGDTGSTKYSPLAQIDGANFERLEVAWSWTSVDADLDIEALQEVNPDVNINNFQGTPLKIDDRLYIITALNLISAIDAATGETLWTHNPEVYLSGPPINIIGYHSRGVAYWSDGEEERILAATNDGYLLSLDANTGLPDPDFNGGRVDLSIGIPRATRGDLDYLGAQPVSVVSPPIVIGDILVTSQITQARPLMRERPPMWVRGFDIRTGETVWTFHTIPEAGEFGVESWGEESWRRTGNTGVWSMMSADSELGLVYLPVEAPTDDFWGGNRPGDNLFSQSLVAVDAQTGERRWHFQMIHHGIWDYDPPAAPNLIDITVAGRDIKAVAQVTKQGFVYTFDRATGEPVWLLEERQVPQAPTIPGERLSPTQPFPTRPPAFEKQGLAIDDLIDFTPELRAEAIEIVSEYTYGPLYTPTTLTVRGGNRGTVIRPSAGGGANWMGASVDPTTAIIYIPSSDSITVPVMVETDPAQSTLTYRRISNSGIRGPQGLPILKPPYATITAIDMNSGNIVWQVPNGDRFPRAENHPALEGIDLPPMGGGGRNPILVTPTLLVHAQNYSDGALLVARDKAKGAELASIPLPASARAAPMSYEHEGRQYIVVAVLTEAAPQLIAYALPN